MPRRNHNLAKVRKRPLVGSGPPRKLPTDLRRKWHGYQPDAKRYAESPYPDG